MSNAVTIKQDQSQLDAITAIILNGDISKLNPDQRALYVKSLCDRTGIDYLTRPFDFIVLSGKLTLYANKGATDQLRKVQGVSIKITNREVINEVYVVTAQAKTPDGREDESTGAVSIAGLKGLELANAYLKCETKAKRRVTLSLLGLGMLDESEVADVPSSVTPTANGQPTEADGVLDDGIYRIPFGEFAKRTLDEVASRHGKKQVEILVEAYEDVLSGKKKTRMQMTPERIEQVKEFIDRASGYIVRLENVKGEESNAEI